MTFLMILAVGLGIVVAVFYGLHRLFPKVPEEAWFVAGTFAFIGWFLLCTAAGGM